jgi:hypothetical protein
MEITHEYGRCTVASVVEPIGPWVPAIGCQSGSANSLGMKLFGREIGTRIKTDKLHWFGISILMLQPGDQPGYVVIERSVRTRSFASTCISEPMSQVVAQLLEGHETATSPETAVYTLDRAVK